MARNGGVLNRLQEAVEQRTGLRVEQRERVTHLEEAALEGRALRRELDLLGWNVLDYLSGQEQEVRFDQRIKMAKQARMVWATDPQAGAAVDLSNDFVLGRGLPRPKARDEKVQEAIDDAWDDPDNRLVLTSYEAQTALNTDLELQCNIFPLMFDEGEDGKIKLGLLDHDTVESAVRDPDNRLRILYYMAKRERRGWDFDNDRPSAKPTDVLGDDGKRKVLYYDHWANVEQAKEDEAREEPVPEPPPQKRADGKVKHVALNRTSEMAFGVPTMRRTMRWFTAYNDFMKARVDMAQAAAAFIMKRDIKGTPQQLASLAARSLSRRGAEFAQENVATGPANASILNENEELKHETFNLNSGASNAQIDGQMIRAQTSAATRWPQSYYGDAASSNLATATSLELPVLKHVEARQEIWESMVRWFVDRVIERAVEVGKLDRYSDEDESNTELGGQAAYNGNGQQTGDLGGPAGPLWSQQAHEDAADDERRTERDLTYEFSMPNPLQRALADIVNAVATVARTFDPNNTNTELSRSLLALVFTELGIEDPVKAVDRILPEGYVDPMIAAAQQAQQPPEPPPDQFGPPGGSPFGGQQPPGFQGADQQRHGQGNAYGAPQRSQPPGQAYQSQFMSQGWVDLAQVPAELLVEWQQRMDPANPLLPAIREASIRQFNDSWLDEARFRDLPEVLQMQQRGRLSELEKLFEQEVGAVADEALVGLTSSANGHNGNAGH